MNEREVLKKIQESAKDVEVPQTLEPEQIRDKLKSRQRKKRNRQKLAVTAACLCLCFGAGSAVYSRNSSLNPEKRNQEAPFTEQGEVQELASEGSNADHEDADETDIMRQDGNEQESAAEKAPEAPLKKIGKMFTLASDYGDVYDVLYKSRESDMIQKKEVIMNSRESGGIINVESEYTAEMEKDSLERFAAADSSDMSSASADESAASGSEVDYATTNLQVEGVDESDIVKTDGRYIYVVQEEQIRILDTQNKVPQVVGTIALDIEEDVGQICEMYVADHLLTLIIQAEKTSMRPKEANNETAGNNSEEDETDRNAYTDGEDTAARKASSESEAVQTAAKSSDGKIAEADTAKSSQESISEEAETGLSDEAFFIDTAAVTKILTYDITAPEKPELQNTATQDGWYKTSRKIDRHLYLFTTQSLYPAEEMLRDYAVKSGNESGIIPCVNEEVIRADCIYLPKKGNNGVIMSSIDLGNENKILDTKLLVNDSAQLYVSRNSVYLYDTNYTDGGERTRIARFGLDADGKIRAKAAASLKGQIEDTFAIHERDGYLQVLTSVTSSEPWENRVYVLDENMKVTGKLTGLAKGERIYSARFVGTIGYFVTYRNTDPLFTVDFSDSKKPKIIGELKVTGFSEYLHFWSDNLLLGIGYETDPEDGSTTGVKLSMFDISNPAKVKEKARVVLKDADESAAMYDYKCVLVNRNKNIIALTTESYQKNGQLDYRAFSFKKGKFVSALKHTLNKKYSYRNNGNSWRSLYIGDLLYLVNAQKAIVFDMNDGYKKIGKVKYAQK